jgi:hypothetical protein
MKTRKGFVSNSSTSSFLIYGTCVDSLEDSIKDQEVLDAADKSDYSWELMEEVEKKYGFSVRCPYDYDYYVGASWSSIGDDETGKQFKERVAEGLRKLFGDDIKLGTHSEAWRDD